MMPGKRIPQLDAIAGASTANDDNLVIFDTSEGTTKRILRSQLAAGVVGDLPYTPSGGISATTVPTAIAELDSEAAKSAALAAQGGAALIGNTPAGTIAATTVQGAINEIVSDLAASSGSSLVGYQPAGTGAVSTDVQSKLRESVSVKDFGAAGDGVTDDTAAIQTAVDYTYAIGGTLEFPDTGTYIVSQPIVVDPPSNAFRNIGITIVGKGATIKASSSFVTTNNKGIFESLVRKNGVNKVASRENVVFRGLKIDGSGQFIAGFALSGFVRGSSVEYCQVTGCYNGIMVSGSWSFSIVHNKIKSNIANVGILLGADIDMTIVGTGYLDNGANTAGIEQEGYELSPGNTSIQCNEVLIARNFCGGCKHGIAVHFGNPINIISNTSELNTNTNLRITALESGSVRSNYFEGGLGIILGRDSGGIAQNISFEDNFLNAQNIIQRGFLESTFLRNNLFGGTARTSIGAFQRNYGNISQIPNTANLSDSSPLRPDYTFGRDNVYSTAGANKVNHSGLLTTALDNCFLHTGFRRPNDLNPGDAFDVLKPGSAALGLRYTTVLDVDTTATSITSTNRSTFAVVIGEDTTLNTRRFIDVVLFIASGSAVVIASHGRTTPAARTYTVSTTNLQLAMASGTYSVRTASISS
jgi:hypothetical protein